MIQKINIKTFQVGLVFKNDKLTKVLTEGKHFLFGTQLQILYFDMRTPFETTWDLDLLLTNDSLAQMLEVVEVADYDVVLQFVNKNFQSVLKKGKYAFWKGIYHYQFMTYNMMNEFIPPTNLDLLLEHPDLATLLNIITVKDNEIVLQYVNDNFKEVLTAGKYAFWKSCTQYDFKWFDLNATETIEKIDKKLLEHPKIRSFVQKIEVLNYEKGLLFINGKWTEVLESGIYNFWNNGNLLEVKVADLRQQQMEISGQEILTKDKANLRINFFVKYQVTTIEKALIANKDYEKQLYIVMQLALRAYVGGFTLDELLTKKEEITQTLLVETKTKVEPLGVEILDAGIRDVILPGDMKEIMNQVLVAEKKAQANMIMRREETASMRSMLNTAKLMEENEMLWKLKEMEYVEKIADKIGEITISGSGNIIGQLKEIFVK
ncbi:slipin family protein [Flavobacterium columnare]|uniref:slipin family protein n=1 Tax=Flavobacterium columnare TaxID=996 RepID=UPI004033E4A0